MSEADKDGRILQAEQDRHAVYAMELHEGILAAEQAIRATLSAMGDQRWKP